MKNYNTLLRLLLISFTLLLTVACNFENKENASKLDALTNNEAEQTNNTDDNSSANNTDTVFAKPNVYSVNQTDDSIEIFWDPISAAEFRVIVWPKNDLPQIYVTTDFEFSTPEITSSGEHIIMIEAYDELGNSLFSDPSTLEVL